MPLKIEPPVRKIFTLERSDKELGNTGVPTTVTVIQAREGQNIERQQLWEKYERTFVEKGDLRVAQEVNPAAVKRREVFLTLVDSNIEIVIDEKGTAKPLFKFPLKEKEFNDAWAQLPPMMADEIYEKVLEMNIDWAVSGEAG